MQDEARFVARASLISPGERYRTRMIELLRTNDVVLISRIEALLAEHEIDVFVADQYMSVMEGSSGFLPRRIMIGRDDLGRVRMALHHAGLLDQLSRG